jgi:hypothetical protein
MSILTKINEDKFNLDKSKPINIKKNNDPNFSIYIENKIKNTPPREDLLEKQINSIYPKATYEWIDSDLVTKCQLCSIQFNWYYRKHHCRSCGGVFCSVCCNTYTIIPKKLIDIPKETTLLSIQAKQIITKITDTVGLYTSNTTNTNINPNININNSLVCTECFNKINKLLEIQHIIKICEFLSLPELYNVCKINKNWCNAAIHCISLFRNIQYKHADYIFNKWECNIVNSLAIYLNGHNQWFILLIKTSLVNNMLYNNNNLQDIINLIKSYNKNKNKNCWNLMCSRKCNLDLDLLDLLEIISYISYIPNSNNTFWNNKNYLVLILEIAENIMDSNSTKLNILNNTIPFLTTSLRFLLNNASKNKKKFVIKLLDLIIKFDNNSLIFLCFEYNYLKNIEHLDNSFVELNKILNAYLSINLIFEYKLLINNTINTINEIYTNKNFNINQLPLIYPFDTNYLITEILGIIELQSNSKPLLLIVNIQKFELSSNLNNLGEKIQKKIIIKNDSQLRKENIVSSLIILLQDKLLLQASRERIDKFEPIPTYRVIMIDHHIGIIEFLENCLTLKHISQKNYTLQNYILENNKETKIGIIKERFAKSLAISSCLSYVLGLGDRHANNIMLSNSGHIIHIDYGYILENPIHSNIVNNPIIRISGEMIDFLGGWNSEYYELFKKYTIQVFDIFRLYSNIIINYYNILGHEKIMDWNKFKKRLTDRFMNGLSFKDIEVVLLDVIETSSKSYGGVFMDLCNEYSSLIKGWM